MEISSENLTATIEGNMITFNGKTDTFGSYKTQKHRGSLHLSLFDEEGEFKYSLFFNNYEIK